MQVGDAGDAELAVNLIDDLECGAVPLEEIKTIFHGEERFRSALTAFRKLLRDIEAGRDPRPARGARKAPAAADTATAPPPAAASPKDPPAPEGADRAALLRRRLRKMAGGAG